MTSLREVPSLRKVPSSPSYSTFIKNLATKKVFLVQVFATLLFELLVTFGGITLSENVIQSSSNSQMIHIATVIATFVLIFAIIYTRSVPLKFAFFTLFALCIGVTITYGLNNVSISSEDIKHALLSTAVLFVFVVTFSFFLASFGLKIPPAFGAGLFIALTLLILVVLFSLVAKDSTQIVHQKVLSGATIFLFILFIGFDTINILSRDYKGDFIMASMDYFLDILNLFQGEWGRL